MAFRGGDDDGDGECDGWGNSLWPAMQGELDGDGRE